VIILTIAPLGEVPSWPRNRPGTGPADP